MFQKHTVEESIVETQDRVWVKGWFPVLFELTIIVNHCMLDVRARYVYAMWFKSKYKTQDMVQDILLTIYKFTFSLKDSFLESVAIFIQACQTTNSLKVWHL